MVAKMFLSAFLQVLFDRLTPHARNLWNLARQQGLEEKLENLMNLFRKIEAVLADAEEKQLDDRAVKLWLDDLKDLAYDTEDVLDEFATVALRQEVFAKQQASSSKLPKLVPACFLPSSKMFIDMGSKIDDIVNRLKEISERKKQLCLVENVSSSSARSWRATPTTSLPIEALVYGRSEDRAKIIDLLMMNERNCDVIPIVGMGGTGKTTLAQHVYKDEAVAETFETKAWVCVSDDFDLKRIMKAALQDLTSKPCELKELPSIQAELEHALVGKRFLIVLDDIWDYNFRYSKWLALTSVFRVGASGSKIIVTTRQEQVASTIGTIAPYMLKLLSDEDCWLLFKTHAFKRQDVGMQTISKVVREKIIEKCKGLPLAARALGGLFSREPTDEWQDILVSGVWKVEGGVLPVLRLSYHYLPPQLKKCFAYCAIFPQDYEFKEEELVLLWVAEGLIQQTEGNKHVIEVASMYFHALVSRCIFQASTNHHSTYIINDLVHDLAQEVAGDTCLRLESILEHSDGIPRARHVSYLSHSFDSKKRFEVLHRAELVRTFLPFQTSYVTSYLANSVLHQLPRLKKLRVLSLRGYDIVELPDSIGDLKHLRYLDLSSTDIRYLPKSICLLNNLQILLLRDCCHLRKLPSRMEYLIDLLYLDITNCIALKEMPMGLKELKSLQVLPNFFVSKDDVSGVKELMNFKDLRGTLCISNLENVDDVNDAKKANLNEKKYLDILVLEWGRSYGEFRNADIEKHVLNMLQPPRNLKQLTIIRYDGNMFPKWLGDPSFSSMEVLTLESCERCTRLPPLGQLPSLKVLEVKGMRGVQSVGAEFYGSTCSKVFPSLKSLTFGDMQGWESWTGFEVSNQVDAFSCLRELSLLRCPKLSGKLPRHLPSLKKLVIDRCKMLIDVVSSFPELCKLEIIRCQGLAGASTIEMKKVEDLSIEGDGCEELINTNLPCTVEYLHLRNCSMLDRLPVTFYSLKHLRRLEIYGCSSLVSLPIALLFSAVLEELSIDKCNKLKSFLNEVGEDLDSNILSTSVRKKLNVSDCASLGHLSSRGVFPVPLTDLTIRGCSELECVAEILPASLRIIKVFHCHALKSVAETFADDTKLESIEVGNCEDFQRFPDGLNSLIHLQEIMLRSCPSFLSFPQGGLPSTNLTELNISGCKNLKALPNGMCNLTSLRRLKISGSPSINFVPEEGFLANLVILELWGDNTIRPLMEWGLDRLTSLKELEIGPIGLHRCPELMITSLPSSLTTLSISYLPMLMNLPSLPISLTTLTIYEFPMLITLPSLPIFLTNVSILSCSNLEFLSSNCFRNLTSLEDLTIWECPKLKSLPKKGLPRSLCKLSIADCPLLEKRCRRDKGEDWSKIADIPCVYINHKFIYAPTT